MKLATSHILEALMSFAGVHMRLVVETCCATLASLPELVLSRVAFASVVELTIHYSVRVIIIIVNQKAIKHRAYAVVLMRESASE